LCGRFTLSVEDRDEVAAALGIPVEKVPDSWIARYNIAPMQRHFELCQISGRGPDFGSRRS
jgi:hypothetical protein